MQADFAEQMRLLTNLLRLGTIAEIDYASATARVQSGKILTDFLPWLTFRAGNAQTWSPPSLGEQCLVLNMSGDMSTGVILPSVYTSNAPSQSPNEHLIYFPDGAMIYYNHASGHLSVKNCKTANIHATESVTADTPHFICTQDVTIKGNLKVDKAISATGSIRTTQSVTASGGISSTGGDVKAGAISLKNHYHIEQGDNKATSNAK